jgi:3-deoxy-D-manno-octulosonic acid kinase
VIGGNRRNVPAGYRRFALGDAQVVAMDALANVIAEAMGDGTLYAYGQTHPKARKLIGRGIAYAVPLPDGLTRVVIRHSRHGGVLAPVTGDRFIGRTRAPFELATALRLASAGVRTPEIIAYATYPAGALFRRSDVATREIVGGRDLAFVLLGSPSDAVKRAALEATAGLLAHLTRAGARHPDLNLKNVLLTRDDSNAYVLDVDRVVFGRAGDPAITRRNFLRLERSAYKWQRLYGADIGPADLNWLRSALREQLSS